MSILLENDTGYVISHEEFINNVYKYTSKDDSFYKYYINNELFNIEKPFKISPESNGYCDIKTKKRKRKHSKNIDFKVRLIQEKYLKILELAKSKNILNSNYESINDDCSNDKARKTAEYCTSSSIDLRDTNSLSGGNTAPYSLYQHVNSFNILLPSNCRFINGDVSIVLTQMDGEKYDFVTLDPPWWNKYIRRCKAARPDHSYQMMHNEEIANIHLKPLLSDGAIVCVWCTNCVAHENAVKDMMFPKWGVKYMATWFWMKVTKNGLPVCPFTAANGKQPFERIIIGVHNLLPNQHAPSDEKVILSVPSALHSHKPPLNDLFSSFLATNTPKCLEIFARYLLPNTTSIGLETLRWQHSNLYFQETASQ